jgi:inhibitor of KinA sporulation pathway (predicted exonuclease)
MEEFSYIVLDLEWNQPMPGQETITQPFRFDSEIIEIGALKLNSRFEEVSEFKSFVRPVFYPSMNGHVVQLTKIRPQELEKAPDFPAAYAAFRDWCGEDCCLCTWGPDDLPVLMDNLLMHGLDAALPDGYDLQRIFGHEIMRDDRQCSLERAMELLH